MMYYSGDWAWWAWIPMTVVMALFWGLLIWAVVTLVRGRGFFTSPAEPAEREARSSPEDILAERLARGEIDVDEYERRMDAVRGRGRRGD